MRGDGKGKAGRPTKYSAAVHEAAQGYLDGAYIERGDGVPSVAGLARYLGVIRQTLYAWAERHPRFSYMLKEIEVEQHRIALGKGLLGEYNPTICKLVLAKHGYSDRIEQHHSSPDGSMSPPTRIEIVAPDADSAKE